MQYLETFAHTVGVMQHPDAIHRVARECALDLAADGVVYAEVRFAPELSTAQGLPIEAVVEAMVDGFADGGREAAAAGTPIRVGALLCAMRQNDRWDEVAGLVVRYRDAGVVGFDLAGPEIGFPPDRIPSAIALLDRRRAHRTIHAGEADGIESIRAALDGAHAERLGHGVRIADEVADDGTLGPLAQRVLRRAGAAGGRAVVQRADRRLPVAGRAPGRPAAPARLRRHRQHRQPADERGLGRAASSPTSRRTFGWTWDDVQTVTERALAARLPRRGRAGPPARPTSSVRGTRPCATDRAG